VFTTLFETSRSKPKPADDAVAETFGGARRVDLDEPARSSRSPWYHGGMMPSGPPRDVRLVELHHELADLREREVRGRDRDGADGVAGVDRGVQAGDGWSATSERPYAASFAASVISAPPSFAWRMSMSSISNAKYFDWSMTRARCASVRSPARSSSSPSCTSRSSDARST
jgi:hypothetical protein